MIPLKLTLRNFMCYREDATVNFEGIHTACISGSNGNGKSALIDALTWALWGECRASLEDDLIHSGESEARVELEFEVERQRYRVLRRRTKAKTAKTPGKTVLEFQAIGPEGDRPLTGDSVAQTEQKIRNILHMDYPTFINSAFIRQGHANEFSTKRPGERKQILASILQLSVYEELKEMAREQARKAEQACLQLESELSSLQADLAQKPACLADYAAARSSLAQIEGALAQARAALDQLRGRQLELENQGKQLADLELRIQAGERDLRLWNEQRERHRQHLVEYRAIQAARADVEENFKKLVAVRQECRECEARARQYHALEQGRNRLEREIERANDLLNHEHTTLEAQLAELSELAAILPARKKQLADLDNQLRSWQEKENALSARRSQAKSLQGDLQRLKLEKARLAREFAESEEKLHLLSHQEGARCPLCETELGTEGRKRLADKYQRALGAVSEARSANLAETQKAEESSRSLESEIELLEQQIRRGKTEAQTRLGEQSRAVAEALAAEEKARAAAARLGEIEQRLASRDFARVEQSRLAELAAQITLLAYDPARHELLTVQLSEMEGFAGPKQSLDEADKLVPAELEAEARANQALNDLSGRLSADKARRTELSQAVGNLLQLAGQVQAAETAYQDLLAREKALGERLGGLKARVERLAELEQRQEQKREALARAQKEEKVFRDLVQAYGKEGVQAMLIELAIPEIENEANKLLALMTDGRMHLKLESQKPTQKGEVVETLDINISDELGTRSYEMFSGGEAFRIDFALRIALSRLLAHRAGAALSTLIIDEGFGTQDSSGIEKIKEAITSIQDSFDKILVITHIADFKDAFPARIEVVKTSEGSSLFLN